MGAKLTKTFQNKRLTNMIPIIAFGGTIMIIGIFTLQQKSQMNDQKKQKNLYMDNDESIKSIDTRVSQMSKTIVVEYDQTYQILSLSTIIDIMEKSPLLVQDVFVPKTIESRQIRRQLLNRDNTEYIKQLVDYHEYIEVLIEESQLKLLDQLKLSRQQLEDSVLKWIELGHMQEFMVLQTVSRQRLKEQIGYNRVCNRNELRDYLQWQLSYLQQKPEIIKEIVKQMSLDDDRYQLVALIINTILGDIAYDKYKIEEEDMLYSLQQNIKDIELQQICNSIGEELDLVIQ